jgi:hypothetical protein
VNLCNKYKSSKGNNTISLEESRTALKSIFNPRSTFTGDISKNIEKDVSRKIINFQAVG